MLFLRSMKSSVPSNLFHDFNNMNVDYWPRYPGYEGSKFNWSNNRKGSSYVGARLHRALISNSWSTAFQDLTFFPFPE